MHYIDNPDGNKKICKPSETVSKGLALTQGEFTIETWFEMFAFSQEQLSHFSERLIKMSNVHSDPVAMCDVILTDLFPACFVPKKARNSTTHLVLDRECRYTIIVTNGLLSVKKELAGQSTFKIETTAEVFVAIVRYQILSNNDKLADFPNAGNISDDMMKSFHENASKGIRYGDACGGDACGGDACGGDACGVKGCGAKGCAADVCGGDGCVGAVCPTHACAAKVCAGDGCAVDACPLDACAPNVCAVNVCPVIPLI